MLLESLAPELGRFLSRAVSWHGDFTRGKEAASLVEPLPELGAHT